jgi:hypothetical protein
MKYNVFHFERSLRREKSLLRKVQLFPLWGSGGLERKAWAFSAAHFPAFGFIPPKKARDTASIRANQETFYVFVNV